MMTLSSAGTVMQLHSLRARETRSNYWYVREFQAWNPPSEHVRNMSDERSGKKTWLIADKWPFERTVGLNVSVLIEQISDSLVPQMIYAFVFAGTETDVTFPWRSLGSRIATSPHGVTVSAVMLSPNGFVGPHMRSFFWLMCSRKRICRMRQVKAMRRFAL